MTNPSEEDLVRILKVLTPAQRRGLMTLRTDIHYSPGEVLQNDRGSIRSDVARRLRREGLAESIGLHPWGPHPVYSLSLTTLGKRVASELEKTENT